MKISLKGLYNKQTPFKVRRFFDAILIGAAFVAPQLHGQPHVAEIVMWVSVVAKIGSNLIVEDDHVKPTGKP